MSTTPPLLSLFTIAASKEWSLLLNDNSADSCNGPPVVRKALHGASGWERWGEGVRQRSVAVGEQIEHSLFWGVNGIDGPQLESRLQETRDDFHCGQCSAMADAFTFTGALATLDVLWQLSRAGGKLAWPEWHAAVTSIESILDDATSLHPEESPLLHQILCGELPLTLALLFPDFITSREWLSLAMAAFNEGFEAILDGGGLTRSDHLPLLRPLLGCWTRSLGLTTFCDKPAWNRATRQQYSFVLEQVLRLTRRDGTAVFAPFEETSPDEVFSTEQMLQAAIALDRDDDNTDIALLVLPQFASKRHATLAGRRRDGIRLDRLPDSSSLSEWSSVSVLRSGWNHGEPSIAVATPAIYATSPESIPPRGGWSDEQFQIELNLRSRTFLSGAWRLGIADGKRTLAVTTPWTETGAISEAEYDYLEWELTLEDGTRLERQIVLAHDAELLLLADTLIPATTTATSSLRYTSSLPLVLHQITASLDREATEVAFTERGGAASAIPNRLFPLFLPEWQKSQSLGRLGVSGGSLDIAWNAPEPGSRGTIFLPMVIDLSATRGKHPFTWRPLTVGENREAVPRHQASGYRLACGDDQFLLYRSHTEPRNRTVLGHNLVSEFLLASFSPDDGVSVIAEIGRDDD